MVNTVMSSMAIATIAADDVASLLQLSAGVRQSQGQHILAAVAEEGKDTICVEAAAGDVAPVAGSFMARMNQHAVLVAAGSVAPEAGSFCVAKQDVLLFQRTFGLNTARDFEVALGSKNNKAPEVALGPKNNKAPDWANFDFAGDLTKEVTVKKGECPNVKVGLMQTVETSVSEKQQNTAETKLDADQLRVCACRNFLGDNARTEWTVPFGHVLAKRSAGAGASPACTSCANTTFGGAARNPQRICVESGAVASWALFAKTLNDPSQAVQGLYKESNITGGWQHCDKSWVVQGACAEYLPGWKPTA